MTLYIFQLGGGNYSESGIVNAEFAYLIGVGRTQRERIDVLYWLFLLGDITTL